MCSEEILFIFMLLSWIFLPFYNAEMLFVDLFIEIGLAFSILFLCVWIGNSMWMRRSNT